MSRTDDGGYWRSENAKKLTPKAKQQIRTRLSDMAELYWAQVDRSDFRRLDDDGDKFRMRDLPDYLDVRPEWLTHLQGHIIERVGEIPNRPSKSRVFYWRLSDTAKAEIEKRVFEARGRGMPCCNATDVKWDVLDDPLGGEAWEREAGTETLPTASPERWPYRCQHCGTHHSRRTLKWALERNTEDLQ